MFVTHDLPLSVKTDNVCLSVTISESTWKRMELNTGGQHPYGHEQMVKLKDKTALS